MEVIRTTSIKIKDKRIKSKIIKDSTSYRHFENMYLILLKVNSPNKFKKNPYLRLLSDFRVMRAVLRNTSGGKRKEEVATIRKEFSNDSLFTQLKEHSQGLKLNNLVMIMRRVNGEYKKYYTDLKKKKGTTNLPSAKKLEGLKKYSIPLDASAWSFKKKNKIGINLTNNMFYIHANIGRLKNIIGDVKNVQSVLIKYSNSEIYLQISYNLVIEDNSLLTNSNNKQKKKNRKKVAGLDIGINNLATLFVDDKTTQSLVVSGARYKHYNSKHNRLKAKVDKSISKNATVFEERSPGYYHECSWNKKGKDLKKYKTYLIEKRNQYFKNEFHKISKRLSEYCYINGVTDLYISRNLTFMKNKKKRKGEYKSVNMGKFTQTFIQMPFGKLLDYLEYKLEELGIRVHKVDESYTSITSCINADVKRVQRKQKKTFTKSIKELNKNRKEYNSDKGAECPKSKFKKQMSVSTNDLNASRVKRGLLKDNISNVVFNADLNGAVNHIKVATNKKFKWLPNHMDKLCNPVKIKCDYDFNKLLLNSVSSKGILDNLRTQRCRVS